MLLLLLNDCNQLCMFNLSYIPSEEHLLDGGYQIYQLCMLTLCILKESEFIGRGQNYLSAVEGGRPGGFHEWSKHGNLFAKKTPWQEFGTGRPHTSNILVLKLSYHMTIPPPILAPP